jgi:hypothetical protein
MREDLIMPQMGYVPHPDGITAEEHQALLNLRRTAMDQVAKKCGEFFERQVASRRGWKAHIRLMGRDRDGSLKAHILVTGPRWEIAWRQQVRLVKKHDLPWSLGRE